MEVTFKYKLGELVTIVDAKIEGRIVEASVDANMIRTYTVMFWHEGARVAFTVNEWELK